MFVLVQNMRNSSVVLLVEVIMLIVVVPDIPLEQLEGKNRLEAAFVGLAYTTTVALEVDSGMVVEGVVSFDIGLQLAAKLVADTLAMAEARFVYMVVVTRILAITVVGWN